MIDKFLTLKLNYKLTSLLIILIIISCLHFGVSYIFNTSDLLNEDIFFSWKEGNILAQGLNPYERIIGSDLRVNNKYPTYLPFFYVFTAILSKLGLNTFESFIKSWRVINLLSHVTILLLVYDLFNKKRLALQGIFAVSIIGFSNISLYIIKVQHLEFFSVVFFLLSINFLNKKPFLSGIFMAISILIKHFAIIFLPFILIKLFFSENHNGKVLLSKFSKASLSTLALFIIPFIVWNPVGFIYSIGFSITRATTFPLLDDAYKFIFLILYLGIIYLSKKVKNIPYQLSFLSIFLFTEFNPSVFRQYYFWVLILGILAFYEITLRYKEKKYT